jgi:hypothetical protein
MIWNFTANVEMPVMYVLYSLCCISHGKVQYCCKVYFFRYAQTFIGNVTTIYIYISHGRTNHLEWEYISHGQGNATRDRDLRIGAYG